MKAKIIYKIDGREVYSRAVGVVQILVEIAESKLGSVQKLADAMGITRAAINHWLRGRARPARDTLAKLARIAGVRGP